MDDRKPLSAEEACKRWPKAPAAPTKPASRDPLDDLPFMPEYDVAYLDYFRVQVPRQVLERAVPMLRARGRHFRKHSMDEASGFLEELAGRIRQRNAMADAGDGDPYQLTQDEEQKACEMMGIYFACLVAAGRAGEVMQKEKSDAET